MATATSVFMVLTFGGNGYASSIATSIRLSTFSSVRSTGIIKKAPIAGALAAAAEDLNVEIADFLTQRVAIDPEQICGADLVPASGRKRHRQERMLDLPEHPVVEARRRQSVAEAREIRAQMPLDGG